MSARPLVFIAILLLTLCSGEWSAASAEEAPAEAANWQLLNGDAYLAMAEYDREVYVSGLNDAYNWTVRGGFERMRWMPECVHGRSARQLAAMFTKWLRRNPERWHEPAGKLYPFAIFELCRADRQEAPGGQN